MSLDDDITAMEELREALRAQVKRDGPYTLASGATSDWYLDCRPITFTYPRLVAKAVRVALQLAKIPDPAPTSPTIFAGVALAGVPIATALACAPWPGLTTSMAIRPEPKDHGMDGCCVGIPMGDPPKVVICDDVFTSGGSLLRATYRLQEEWAIDPVMYLTLFNRNEDHQGMDSFGGVPFCSVFGLTDILGPI